MPSSASNPQDSKGASSSSAPDEVQHDEKPTQAVETFAFEVSAGSAPTLDGLKSPVAEPPVAAPVDLPADEVTADKSNATDGLPTGILVEQNLIEQNAVQPIKRAAVAPAIVATEVITPKEVHVEPAKEGVDSNAKIVQRVARQSTWWVTSLGVHVVVLVALAFSTLAIIREEKLELYATSAVYEPVEEFQDLEIDPTEDLESLDEDFSEPDPAPLEDMSSELLVEEPAITESAVSDSPATEVSESLSELGGLLGDISSGVGGMDSEVGVGTGGGMAKFFGTEVKARRILYMLDNSGGMRKNGKFEALVSELKKSVSGLDAKQQFYVVFYSDTVYPLFYPQGVRKFVRSNDRNRKLLDRWLASVELCGGNAIDEALAAAEVIRPETVFLLTDGDLFTTEKKKALLLNPDGRSYSIHTFGLGVGEKTKTADRLRQVAEANSGTFRAIEVTEEMEALAQEMQRPYHSKAPGAIWGLKVGSR